MPPLDCNPPPPPLPSPPPPLPMFGADSQKFAWAPLAPREFKLMFCSHFWRSIAFFFRLPNLGDHNVRGALCAQCCIKKMK